MAHYVSRLDTRTSETPKEWLETCKQIAEVVNNWAIRGDIVVYAGSDAGIGHTACFIKTSAEMEINIPVAFGTWATPEFVGDLRDRSNQFEWASATGIIYHEALHARFSIWEQAKLDTMSEPVFQAFQVLDESRIERFGVIAMPENQVFLRCSAMELALQGMDEASVEALSDVRLSAVACALAMARVDAGVLKISDVSSTYSKVISAIGQELFDELRSIWYEFQRLECSQIKRATELATKWVELLDKADPDGKGGCKFPTGKKGEKGESGFGTELIDAMDTDTENSASDVEKELGEQQGKEKDSKTLQEHNSKQQQRNKSKKEASKVFTNATGNGDSSSRSQLENQRPPKPAERANAVRLSKMLEKAKYRERSITEIKSVFPQGRLKTRVAIQNLAMKSKGIHSDLPAWRATKRKHTDDPELTIGVMVDISGSMSGAMESMATTAWVLSEAGRRIQARTGMVYFGNDVFATLKLGQKLEQVSVWTAPDGTEVFGQAFQAIDGHLDLLYGSGIRMLVVVSDGQYTDDETRNAKEFVKMCADNGVAVLWIVPAGCYAHTPPLLVGNNGVVLSGLDVNEIANTIGKSATRALEKVGGV